MNTSARLPHRAHAHLRLLIAALATPLLAVSLYAENTTPPPAGAKEQPANRASAIRSEKGELVYSVKFEGGHVDSLAQVVRNAFPNDNVILTESAARVRLPGFQILNARLPELARSIAFLSGGTLTIEVMEADAPPSGNIWRIGVPTAGALAVKMRAVAAPHLIADPERLRKWISAARDVESNRDAWTTELTGHQTVQTNVQPLTEQKVIVLIGSEDGVAGLESLVKASEQIATDDDARDIAEKQARLFEQKVAEREKAAKDAEDARKKANGQ